MYGAGHHWPQHGQAPPHGTYPDSAYPAAYTELPYDFLEQQNTEIFPPLDHRLTKHLSLSEAQWASVPEEGEDAYSMQYGGRRAQRHSRSVSMGFDNWRGQHSQPAQRQHPGPGQGGFHSGGSQHGFNPSGRGGRLPFAGRTQVTQGGPPPSGRGEGGERGQGYRKLWQQVTKVGRGQKLGEGAEAVPFSDMTVEDLLRIVRNLPPEESAVQAVSRGLYYLDSRALAALLKELHKVGLSNRAAELFDWLRGLAEGHELAHLCDVYTYTTLISQCGSHQQLRKALELVAEMRGRGISCNVHTYSALMNVCIKANELDLAIDVYGQLLREGCTPNLVTYNILIDVHGKTGNWAEAVKVLDALESQGTKPEVRTYNTIINACNRSGQPEHALKVYERMIADGTQPTATTYTALISAYGKTGKVEEAMQIFQDMVSRGCERNVITYSSLITACEKSGRYQLALDFFNEMHRDNVKPNVVTYNALIAACGQGGQWETAREIFDGMISNGCKPDAITYGTLIAALDRGGQWGHALQAFEDMQNQGHRPDVGVFNTLVEVLSRSGTSPATLRAAQLFLNASRQGQFRMSPQSPTETTVIAFTVGAATLATLHWLQDLRSRISGAAGASTTSDVPQPWSSPAAKALTPVPSTASPGTTSPSHASPTAAATGDSRERAQLLLLKGKQGRSESSPVAIEAACHALLTAANVPHAVVQTPQGIRVEVEVGGLQAWPDSPELEGVVAPFSLATARKLPTEELIRDDLAVESRCNSAFSAVQTFEDSHPFSGKGPSDDNDSSRRELVGLLINLARQLGLLEQTVHDSVQLLDRLIRRGLAIRTLTSTVLLAAIALIAAQQGQTDHIPTEAMIESATGCTASQVAEMQENVSTALDHDTGAISAVRVLHLYLERLLINFEESALASRVAGDALTIISETFYEGSLVNFRPSLVAAAVLYLSRKAVGSSPFWPQALVKLTGYDDPQSGNFAAAIEAAAKLVPRQPNTASLILDPSPVPTTGSPTPLGSTVSPPLSQASLPALASLSLGGSMPDRTPPTVQFGHTRNSSLGGGLRPTLSGSGLSRTGANPVGQGGLDSLALPRTPSLPSGVQSAGTTLQPTSSFPANTQLL